MLWASGRVARVSAKSIIEGVARVSPRNVGRLAGVQSTVAPRFASQERTRSRGTIVSTHFFTRSDFPKPRSAYFFALTRSEILSYSALVMMRRVTRSLGSS